MAEMWYGGVVKLYVTAVRYSVQALGGITDIALGIEGNKSKLPLIGS